MRTIKFRGKKPTNGLWAYGSLAASDELNAAIYFQVGKGGIKQMEWVYVNPDTVGQFTGLKDKNGQEIYEGDIVQEGRFVYAVEYNANRYASFGLRRDGDMFMHYFGEALEADECEVIGNIHDNPELLKPKQP